MLVEAVIENNEMKILNFPKNIFKGTHFQVDIKPIKIKKSNDNDFILNLINNPIQVPKDTVFLTREEANER